MDVTLFELHLSDAEFNAPFSGRGPTGEADDSVTTEAATDGEPTLRLGPLAALLALAGLALLARYLRGSEAEQAAIDELEA